MELKRIRLTQTIALSFLGSVYQTIFLQIFPESRKVFGKILAITLAVKQIYMTIEFVFLFLCKRSFLFTIISAVNFSLGFFSHK